jgi:hypothetical protein
MFENFLFGFLIDFTLSMLLASPAITSSRSSTCKSNGILPLGVLFEGNVVEHLKIVVNYVNIRG